MREAEAKTLPVEPCYFFFFLAAFLAGLAAFFFLATLASSEKIDPVSYSVGSCDDFTPKRLFAATTCEQSSPLTRNGHPITRPDDQSSAAFLLNVETTCLRVNIIRRLTVRILLISATVFSRKQLTS